MRITIGGATEDSMSLLGIQSYPFTSRELSIAFRTKLKEVHPDMNNGGEKKQNTETRQVIEAYKHLKNLAVDPQKPDETYGVIIEEDFDIFKLYETCPDCHGSRIHTYQVGGGWCPDCAPSFLFSLWSSRSRGYTYKTCDRCGGTGKYFDKGPCFKCNGLGVTKIRCRTCKGTGFLNSKIFNEPCSTCKGKGKVEIDPWNPVIPKGAVLGRKIDKKV
jgi:DnaJ-class molecular chaperone